MHQQVRVSTKTERSGPGAQAANEGGLLDILRILEEEREDGPRINLRVAGGTKLAGNGTFVFSTDDEHLERARDRLIDAGYADAELVDVEKCDLPDEPGALLGCITETEDRGHMVDEIFVGSANPDGTIPVQLVTRGAGEGASASF